MVSFAHLNLTNVELGNDDQKAELEQRAMEFGVKDVKAWFMNKPKTLMEVAEENFANRSFHEKAIRYNPYEGIPYAKQSKESVDTFLKRLPPATTELPSGNFWIWIANPFHRIPGTEIRDDDDDDDGDVQMGDDAS